jgi:hypothetical protein
MSTEHGSDLPYLARLVRRKRWQPRGSDDVAADALGDLRSQGNKLSFWRCNQDDASLADVVLALASTRDRPDKLEFVVVPVAELREAFRMDSTPGETPARDVRDRHVDLTDLTARSLTRLAMALLAQVQSEERHRIYSKREVLSILADAVDQGRLEIDKLKEKLRDELDKEQRRRPGR